jgi:hypothetical protein
VRGGDFRTTRPVKSILSLYNKKQQNKMVQFFDFFLFPTRRGSGINPRHVWRILSFHEHLFVFFPHNSHEETDLELVGVLQEAGLGGETVDGIVSATLAADETAEGKGSKLTSVVAIGIDVTNVDLDGSVVLGSDQAVGGGAAQSERCDIRTRTLYKQGIWNGIEGVQTVLKSNRKKLFREDPLRSLGSLDSPPTRQFVFKMQRAVEKW